MEQYLLGIDVGTTGTKTLLITTEGKVAGHAYRPVEIITPRVGWSEQHAQDWWETVKATVREVTAHLKNPSSVRAISLSLQGGTVVPVDAKGDPLRNAIVWTDGRCEEQFREFLKEGGSDAYAYETCGWHMSRGLPVLQVRWIRDHEPEIFNRTARFLSVPDFISLKMTGIAAVDLADAGINEFFDIRKGVYDEKMLSFAGIGKEQLGIPVRSGEIVGHLTAEAARELGLGEDTLLIAGAHDQYAVAAGAGANRAGDVVIGSGTAWVVTGIADEPKFSTGMAQSVAAVPGRWGSIFSLSTGGICLEWMRNQIAGGISYEEINRETKERQAAFDNLFFFPFQGIAGPEKRFTRASFTGQDLSHDRFHLMKAVMEGVVFQTKWMMESFADVKQGSIRFAGGASKSPVWTQLTADIMNVPVTVPEMADLSCVGAAIIAGWGAGLYKSIEDGSAHLSISGKQIEPDPKRADRYLEAYRRYRRKAKVLWETDQEDLS